MTYCNKQSKMERDIQDRGVPIIGSADISATDVALFTNIGISEKQHDDRYCYRYLYGSIYINGSYKTGGSLV